MLTKDARRQLIALHKECFNDGDYAEHFFEHRLPNGRCYYEEENGVIVSAAYARFFHLILGEKRITVPFITGVATLKKYRGKGYATKVLEKAKLSLLEEGYPFSMLHTFIPNFYRKCGYETCNRVRLISPSSTRENGVEFRALTINDLPLVHNLYSQIIGQEKYYKSRTLLDTELLIGYSLKNGGTGCVITKNGIPKGYLWCEDDEYVEAVAEEENLFNGCQMLIGKNVYLFGGELEYSMARVLDVTKLMEIIPYQNVNKKVSFDLHGTCYELEIENGRFVSLKKLVTTAPVITENQLIAIALGQGKHYNHPLKEVVAQYNIACYEIY